MSARQTEVRDCREWTLYIGIRLVDLEAVITVTKF